MRSLSMFARLLTVFLVIYIVGIIYLYDEYGLSGIFS